MSVLSLQDAAAAHAGSWVLGPVQLELRPGEVVTLIGPNGSGKSTLLRLAAGLHPLRSGTVRLKGRDIAGLDRQTMGRSMAFLPQRVDEPEGYSVLQVAAMGRAARRRGPGFLRSGDLDAVRRCLAQVGAAELEERPFAHLSGGERQRVLLATALAQEPAVLLLDEPTAALDPHHAVRFFRLLHELARQSMAVCVATHDLNLAAAYADRMVLLRDGAMLRQGPPETIIEQTLLSEAYGPGLAVVRDGAGGDRAVVLPAGPEYSAPPQENAA